MTFWKYYPNYIIPLFKFLPLLLTPHRKNSKNISPTTHLVTGYLPASHTSTLAFCVMTLLSFSQSLKYNRLITCLSTLHLHRPRIFSPQKFTCDITRIAQLCFSSKQPQHCSSLCLIRFTYCSHDSRSSVGQGGSSSNGDPEVQGSSKLCHPHTQHMAFAMLWKEKEVWVIMHGVFFARPRNGTHHISPYPIGHITITWL